MTIIYPYSKWQQKRAIKKEYTAAKAGKGAQNTAKASEATAKAAKRAAKDTEKVGSFIVRHKTAILIVGGIVALILIVMAGFSSCSLMFHGAFSGISTTTYPVEDSDILSAEDGYTSMETELREKITNYGPDACKSLGNDKNAAFALKEGDTLKVSVALKDGKYVLTINGVEFEKGVYDPTFVDGGKAYPVIGYSMKDSPKDGFVYTITKINGQPAVTSPKQRAALLQAAHCFVIYR